LDDDCLYRNRGKFSSFNIPTDQENSHPANRIIAHPSAINQPVMATAQIARYPTEKRRSLKWLGLAGDLSTGIIWVLPMVLPRSFVSESIVSR
jgi:hypothetical protein